MRNRYVYSVVFTLVVSAILTTILASINALFLPRISTNLENAEKQALLNVFGVKGSEVEDMDEFFNVNIATQTVDDLEIYVYRDSKEQVVAYAVPFSGPGLWGTIRGFLGVAADLSQIIGIEFTEQSETPGLGSRISESWYKEQFRGIKLDGTKAVLTDAAGELVIDSITGASLTSNSVLSIVNNTIKSSMALLEVVQ